MSSDARTTPRALRLPVLALLVCFAGYNFWCYQNALWTGAPSVARWFATWQMFTLLDGGHSELVAEAEIGGVWEPVELEALFPTRWESGPRYARSSFWETTSKLRVLGAATCGRHPEHPTRVRFHSERWKKTLGTTRQKKRNLKTQELLEWSCARPVSLPKGRPL